MAHGHCVLDKLGYWHTLRFCSQHSSLFHSNNYYAKAPLLLGYMYIACLVQNMLPRAAKPQVILAWCTAHCLGSSNVNINGRSVGNKSHYETINEADIEPYGRE